MAGYGKRPRSLSLVASFAEPGGQARLWNRRVIACAVSLSREHRVPRERLLLQGGKIADFAAQFLRL